MNPLNARDYIEGFLKIRTKQGTLVPLRLNWCQAELYEKLQEQNAEGKPMRAIVLKARQLGISTVSEGLIYSRCATREFTNALVMAHLDSSTGNLFAMHKLFWERSPAEVRPMRAASNAQEIIFDNPERSARRREKNPGLGSRIVCMTAGSGNGVGRSFTFRCVHMSEYAFWRGSKVETYAGIMQTVPAEPGTLVIVESTANGFEEFKELWDDAVAGRNDYAPLFFPWWREPTYRKPVPPGTEWTPEEREIAERFSLDDEQLAWRRWTIRNNCAGDERQFRQEYPATPEEAFLTSGNGVFDNEIVVKRMAALPEPLAVGRFDYDYDGKRITNIRFVPDEYGMVKIYQMPEEGMPYVLGGDTAGEGSDFFTAQVLQNTDGQQVAVLRQELDEVLYARQIYCLGWFYNKALTAIETNYSTYPVQELERLGYPNQYIREVPDTFTGAVKRSFGYNTNSKTRPAMIAGLVAVMLSAPEGIVDRETLGEMLTFIYNDRRRPEAAAGKHDDLVMALAIAEAVRPWQSYTVRETPELPPEKLVKKLTKTGKTRRIR